MNTRKNSTNDQIKRRYQTPGDQIAFSTPQRISRVTGISRSRARKILESLNSYVLHREYKKPHVFNPYFVFKKRELIQSDLIDVQRLNQNNNGVKHLLLLIDVLTKKIWVYPLKNKTAINMIINLEKWIKSLKSDKPISFMSDSGTEFKNKDVQNLFKKNNINFIEAHGTSKAAVAERVNKTLQILLYKYMTQNKTTRYINKLSALVQTYNTRGHRSLKYMTPNEAEETPELVSAIAQEKLAKIKRKAPKLEIGDVVKLKIDDGGLRLSTATRSYNKQFTDENFVINRINTKVPIPLYHLITIDTGERVVGPFYSNELQKISEN